MNARQREELLHTLKVRFEKNPQRHVGIDWASVLTRLDGQSAALRSLQEMEATGGEPDVIGRTHDREGFIFCDCAPESPSGRRSLCYDAAALAARKEHKPASSAVETAARIGVALLTEEEYRSLQELGEFDTKTSSWIATPAEIRERGGALFCDRRYGKTFTYHNGAESYYAARGFRGRLVV
jgi:hypothetical protein